MFSGKRLPEVSLLLCPLALQGLSQGLGEKGTLGWSPRDSVPAGLRGLREKRRRGSPLLANPWVHDKKTSFLG